MCSPHFQYNSNLTRGGRSISMNNAPELSDYSLGYPRPSDERDRSYVPTAISPSYLCLSFYLGIIYSCPIFLIDRMFTTGSARSHKSSPFSFRLHLLVPSTSLGPQHPLMRGSFAYHLGSPLLFLFFQELPSPCICDGASQSYPQRTLTEESEI